MSVQHAPEQLLTTRQVAELLGLTTRQVVYLWTKQRIPGYRLGNGQAVRFRLSELEAALAPDPPPNTGVVEHPPRRVDPEEDLTVREVSALAIQRAIAFTLHGLATEDGYPPGTDIAEAIVDMLLTPEMVYHLEGLATTAPRINDAAEPAPVVYFAVLGDLVKVGVSKNPEQRVESYRGAALVATEPGGYDREHDLHALFAEHRSVREWFQLTPRVRSYVEELPTFTGWPA